MPPGFGNDVYGDFLYGEYPDTVYYADRTWGLSEYGNGSVSLAPFFLGFMPYRRLGRPEWPDPLGVYGIYQRRMTKRGKVSVKMKFYRPTNPQTEPQEANRSKFADGMAAWMALTTEQKEAYNKRAKRRGMRASGLFMREYYQNN